MYLLHFHLPYLFFFFTCFIFFEKYFSQNLKKGNHDQGLSVHNIYFYYENIKFWHIASFAS